MTHRPFYIGTILIADIAALFAGITLFLNEKLRSDLAEIQANNRLKEHLQATHNSQAARYDKHYSRLEVRNKLNNYRRTLTSYVYGRVLETGCGTGFTFPHYRAHLEVTATDYAPKLLAVAQKKLETGVVGEGSQVAITARVLPREADSEKLSEVFREGEFDCLVDFMNFQAYCHPEKVLQEMKTVLKDGGKLVVMCRGLSGFAIIDYFYRVFYPTTMMRYGVDYTRDWSRFFETDPELKCLYKERKNLGKTYLYIFEIHKGEKRKDLGVEEVKGV